MHGTIPIELSNLKTLEWTNRSDLPSNKPSMLPSDTPSSPSAPPICSNLKFSKCKEKKKCSWESKACVDLNCSDYDGIRRSCRIAKPRCKWEWVTKSCLGEGEILSCNKVTQKRKRNSEKTCKQK